MDNIRKKKIIITGQAGSGKIVLIKCLDGHNQLKVSHIHDKIISFFSLEEFEEILINFSHEQTNSFEYPNLRDAFVLKHKNIYFTLTVETLETLLIKYANYDMIRECAQKSTIPDGSSNEAGIEKFKFNFNLFEKSWKQNLVNYKGYVTREELFDLIYESFFYAYEGHPKVNDSNFAFTFLGSNDQIINRSNVIINENFNSQIIFVYRSLRGKIITNALRGKKRELELYNKKKDLKQMIYKHIFSEFIDDAINLETGMLEISKKYPDKVMCINIDKFLNNPKSYIIKIFKYINLHEGTYIFKPTNCKEPVNSNYLNKMNDDDLELSVFTEDLIKIRSKGYKAYVNSKNINIAVIVVYIFFLALRKLNLLNKVIRILTLFRYYFKRFKL